MSQPDIDVTHLVSKYRNLTDGDRYIIGVIDTSVGEIDTSPAEIDTTFLDVAITASKI